MYGPLGYSNIGYKEIFVSKSDSDGDLVEAPGVSGNGSKLRGKKRVTRSGPVWWTLFVWDGP